MKENAPRISEYNKSRIFKATDSLLSVVTLVYIFKAVASVSSGDLSVVDYFVTYILLGLSCLLRVAIRYRTDRPFAIKCGCFAVLFFAAAIAWMFLGVSIAGVVILMETMLIVLLVNRIWSAVTNSKTVYRVFNILLAAVLAVLAVTLPFLTEYRISNILLLHTILAAGMVLFHIIYISFAQMRFSVLRKIIRKTFAAEILFGLVLLIVSFSFIFQTIEPGIKTYFDAVWFCFSVVTTIGFGDLSVTSVLSRVLAIILGVYGIVVVAVITSVIVNFYNEVKDEKNDEPDEEET